MYKQLMKKRPIKIAFLIFISLPCLSVQAKKTDLSQEVTIKSNRQAGDLKNKVISYLENVSITQGSLKIKADLVQVLKQRSDNQDVYVAKGTPATFTQLLDDDSPIVLQANEIRYEPTKNTITIIGNAVLKQEGSEIRGSKITYNTITEQLEAESNNNDAVTTILSPKTKKKD